MGKVKQQISLLVPLSHDNEEFRAKVWHWLKRYWQYELPGVEIVIGHDHGQRGRRKSRTFSKTTAVNDAFKRSHGDVIVILDADTYIPGKIIESCATRIRFARKAKVKLWFVPYRHIY